MVYENIDPNFFSKGHNMMPVKEYSKKYLFSQRNICERNRLANNSVHASGVHVQEQNRQEFH